MTKSDIIDEYYNWLLDKTLEYSLAHLSDNSYAAGATTAYVVAFEKLKSLISQYEKGE